MVLIVSSNRIVSSYRVNRFILSYLSFFFVVFVVRQIQEFHFVNTCLLWETRKTNCFIICIVKFYWKKRRAFAIDGKSFVNNVASFKTIKSNIRNCFYHFDLLKPEFRNISSLIGINQSINYSINQGDA